MWPLPKDCSAWKKCFSCITCIWQSSIYRSMVNLLPCLHCRLRVYWELMLSCLQLGSYLELRPHSGGGPSDPAPEVGPLTLLQRWALWPCSRGGPSDPAPGGLSDPAPEVDSLTLLQGWVLWPCSRGGPSDPAPEVGPLTLLQRWALWPCSRGGPSDPAPEAGSLTLLQRWALWPCSRGGPSDQACSGGGPNRHWTIFIHISLQSKMAPWPRSLFAFHCQIEWHYQIQACIGRNELIKKSHPKTWGKVICFFTSSQQWWFFRKKNQWQKKRGKKKWVAYNVQNSNNNMLHQAGKTGIWKAAKSAEKHNEEDRMQRWNRSDK